LWGGHAAAIYMRATPPVVGPAPELEDPLPWLSAAAQERAALAGQYETLLLPAARTPDDEILKDSCPRQ